MSNNNLAATLRTELGDTVQKLKQLGREETELARQAREVGDAHSDAGRKIKEQLAEVRRTYGQTQKRVDGLANSITKTEKAQMASSRAAQRLAAETKKAGESADKSGKNFGSMAGAVKNGLAGLLGAVQQILQAIDQVDQRMAAVSSRRGDQSLDIATTLQGLGIKGAEQGRVMRGLRDMRGAASYDELVDYVGGLPADGLSGDQVLDIASQYSRAGGKAGALGGSAGTALGQLTAQFGREYSVADLADYARLYTESAGGQGLTPEVTKNVSKIAAFDGLENALAIAAQFQAAGQAEALTQYVSSRQRAADQYGTGTGAPLLLDPSDELQTAMSAVLRRQGQGGQTVAAGPLAGRFAALRGSRDYIGETVQQYAPEAASELTVRAMQRDMEIAEYRQDPGRQREVRGMVLDHQQRMRELGADGAIDSLMAQGMRYSRSVTGDAYQAAWSGAGSNEDVNLRAGNAQTAIEVRIDEQQLQRLGASQGAAAVE